MGWNILRRSSVGTSLYARALQGAVLILLLPLPAAWGMDSTPVTEAQTVAAILPAAAQTFEQTPWAAHDDRSIRRSNQNDTWGQPQIGPSPLPSQQTQEGPAVYSENVPLNPVLERYLAWYQSNAGRKWLQRALDRGAPFRNFIVSRLSAAGLPPELYFLALIESTFVVHAVSRSGAVGMWQFMENSVGDWMTINPWVDERRDFWKSTEAAIEKLQYNYETLKNWLLAIAAYNAGLGFITNLVQRTGIHDFWKLAAEGYLPPETAAYVPKFLAVAAIGSYPGRYGLDVDWAPPLHWVRIEVSRPVDLRVLAERAGIPLSILQKGNAELNYGITPPNGHHLKVPARYKEAALAAIRQSSVGLVRVYEHTIRSGDTYWNICRRFGVPMDLLLRFNPDLSAHALPLGARITIPILQGAPNPSKVDAREQRLAKETEIPLALFTATYDVQHGDTLWSVARRYGVRPEELAAANGISVQSILSIGQTLKVPVAGAED